MPPRSTQRHHPSVNTSAVCHHTVQTSSLERASNNLRDVHNRLRSRIEMFQREEEEAHDLVLRARLLNARLAEVRRKLNMLQVGEEGVAQFFTVTSLAPKERSNVLDTLVHEGTIPDADVPRDFVCPITQMMMIDPVRTVDGHTYERAAIMEWFSHFEGKTGPTSPLTNVPLPSLDLKSDSELRSQIEAFIRDFQSGKDTQMRKDKAMVTSSAQSTAGAPRDTTPIWGSSVVPTQEVNSRELNALRVDPDSVVPPSGQPSIGITRVRPNADTTPIWRSSVVPTQEANSRELNALRVDADSVVPPSGQPSSGITRVRPANSIRRAASQRPLNINHRQMGPR